MNISPAVSAESLAKEVVKGFRARHVSAEYKAHSSLVSHVILTRADFRATIIILSEETFVSVLALKLV